MQNSQNSDLNANNKDNNKVDLSDCYSFTYSDKELKRDKNLPYFEEIKSLIPMTENVAKKIQMIRQRLEEKKVEIQQKINENKSKNQISQKNDNKQNNNSSPKDNLLQQDLAFCDAAISEGYLIEQDSYADTAELKDILEKRDENRPYKVIVDVALKPLPSDRQKDKDKDKDKDKNKDKGKDKDKGKNKDINNKNNEGSKKMTPEEIAYLRTNGKTLSEKGKENNNNDNKNRNTNKNNIITNEILKRKKENMLSS